MLLSLVCPLTFRPDLHTGGSRQMHRLKGLSKTVFEMTFRPAKAASLWISFGLLCCVPGRGFGQQNPTLISTGTYSGLRLYYPHSNDWWIDPSIGGMLGIRVNGGSNPVASFLSGGNVGIGTTNPNGAFDVYGGPIAVGGFPVIDVSGNWVGHPAGVTGPTGATGATGNNGTNGTVGATGATGTTGAPGATGSAGSADLNGVEYMGLTTAHTGNLGGLSGANGFCSSTYAGSRMCTTDDLLIINTSLYITDSGWIAASHIIIYPWAGHGYVVAYGSFTRALSNAGLGATFNYAAAMANVNCTNWSSDSTTYGLIQNGNTLTQRGCAQAFPIMCCQDL